MAMSSCELMFRNVDNKSSVICPSVVSRLGEAHATEKHCTARIPADKLDFFLNETWI